MRPVMKNSSLPLAERFFAVVVFVLAAAAAGAQEKVVIRGSNTIGEELAPRLIAEYTKAHTNVIFDLESKGTAYGIGALIGGFCDIAGASKPVSREQEEIAQIRGIHFKSHVLGAYSVSILVNAGNPVSNLTSNQVQSLFTGKIQNWKEVGGPDIPVHLVIRNPVSGTYLGFKEIAMAFQDYAPEVQLYTNNPGIEDAVASDPGAIGYTGLDPAPRAGAKTVAVDGVPPTAGAVNAHKYPYARTLFLYTNAEKESPAAADFIAFTLSPDGQRILGELGYAPKP